MKYFFDDKNKNLTLESFKRTWKYATLFLGVIIVGFLIKKYYLEKDEYKIFKEYPVLSNSDSVNGIVLFKERVVRGEGTRLRLKYGRKYGIEYARNDLYFPKHYLPDFLKENDSISKMAGNDSLFIYRDSNVYYFILGKRLDKFGNQY